MKKKVGNEMNEKAFEEFYKDGALILDDVSVDVDMDPYATMPDCIHTPVAMDDCNPLELKCDARCQGAGICLMNPFSECYNMSMEDYKEYLEEIKNLKTYCTEFLNSEEGQKMLEELREALQTFEREDRVRGETDGEG